MNFFEHQAAAKRQSRRLIILFGLAILFLVLTNHAILALILKDPFNFKAHGAIHAVVSLLTFSVISLLSYFKIRELRSSGGISIALQMDGRLLDFEGASAQERVLLNIVEEMAIASGVPVPQVFILDHESAINAFAAGFKPTDAAIGVTRGALEALNRDELQGVVAHEFSHLLYGDMRLNTQMVGWLAGLTVYSRMGREIMRAAGRGSSRRRGGGAGQVVLLGLRIWLLGLLGVFFGRLIQAALSRQREFVADASAVQFTRNPGGIGGALQKILAWPSQGELQAVAAADLNHFFISSPGKSWFSSHPSLEDRIRLILKIPDYRPIPQIQIDAKKVEEVANRVRAERAREIIGGLTIATLSAAREVYSARDGLRTLLKLVGRSSRSAAQRSPFKESGGVRESGEAYT